MELRTVDPRALLDNPSNPRGKSPPDHADLQMEASVRTCGILQPPVARELPKGLTIRWGSRRLRAALAVKLPLIPVLVLGPDDPADDDGINATLENIVRKNMSPVDQWRAIEAHVNDRWTEEAIAGVMVLPVRTIRKLRLLAKIHPPMLDRMHLGDMPGERDLRAVAAATPGAQAAAWKKHRPKKGEQVSWWQLAQALAVRRMRAADALFDAGFAAAYGVEYVEDLFAPADEDGRTTANVDGFLAAQHAWIEAHLPENGAVLKAGQYGGAELPPKAQRFYGKPGTGGGQERVGHFLDERTGKVETISFTLPTPAKREAGAGAGAAGAPALPAKPRPDLTQKGEAMVGDMRTDALHAALRAEPIDDLRLVALLVLAFAGQNVSVKTGVPGLEARYGRAAEIAEAVMAGGAITSDPDVLRLAAREMLVHALSCRVNWSQSGAVARVAGDAVGADAHLPNMATQDFLSCLSKAAVGGVAVGLGVPVQPTGKATRGAVIARVGEGSWVYPPAAFSGGAEASDTRHEGERHRTDEDAEPDEPGVDAPHGDDPGGEDVWIDRAYAENVAEAA